MIACNRLEIVYSSDTAKEINVVDISQFCKMNSLCMIQSMARREEYKTAFTFAAHTLIMQLRFLQAFEAPTK